MTKQSVYDTVTDQILEQLEKGTVPWHRPWATSGGVPRSMSTGKTYRGINPFLLSLTAGANGYSSPWWGTYKQIQERGGQVRKGEKATLVVFWKLLKVEPSADERAAGVKVKTIPMLRHFSVFNADQADGLPEKYHPKGETFKHDPIDQADDVVSAWAGRPEIVHGGDRACYSPAADLVRMPERSSFETGHAYYSTLFHELTHSTGHASRLGRPGVVEFHAFGDETYSKEELVAEMGAAMLCGSVGIHQETIPQSAAYLASWIRTLKGDAKLVVQAAAQAQKAADMILGVVYASDEQESAVPELVS